MKPCPECKRPMNAFVPKSRPEKGEFYCEICRKSHRMTEPGEADYYLELNNQSGV